MCQHSPEIRLELPSLLYSFHEPSSCLGNLACCELLQKSRPAEPARSCLGSASEAHRLDPLYFSATVWGCPRARWGTSGVSPSRSKDEVWTASLHRIQWSYSRSLNMCELLCLCRSNSTELKRIGEFLGVFPLISSHWQGKCQNSRATTDRVCDAGMNC
jgi:hypothetical protein